jgi:hypothetical protein
MNLPLPLRRVLPGILPLALALCCTQRVEACDKDKAGICTSTTPVSGEPDVGAMATSAVPTVTILEMMTQHATPETRARAIDLPVTGHWAVPRAATAKPTRGAQAATPAPPPRVTPATRTRPDAARPADRAPVASGSSSARSMPDRQVSRPHRMPSPEIL